VRKHRKVRNGSKYDPAALSEHDGFHPKAGHAAAAVKKLA
jgi:hypothetical protein